MSVITFLAKDRFNWIDNIGTVSLLAFLGGGHVALAIGLWAICLFASLILRIVSAEQRQRTAER